jgi:hypothetical protein
LKEKAMDRRRIGERYRKDIERIKRTRNEISVKVKLR